MISPLIFLSFKLIPYVLIWILFTVIYILMPNTKVNLKAGLVAGIVGGTIFQIAQWGSISVFRSGHDQIQCHLWKFCRTAAVFNVGADQLVGGSFRCRTLICQSECRNLRI